MIHLGDVPAGSILPITFDTFAAAGGSVTMSGFAVTDIEIYAGTSMTQRASDNGVSLLDTDGIDIDGITGIHGFSVDLSDNSDAGFYAVGTRYRIVVSTITVDGQTISFTAAAFRIVAAESIAGKPKVDVDAFGGTVGTFDNGIPQVTIQPVASGSVTSFAAPTQLMFYTNLTDLSETWRNHIFRFTSGNNAGIARPILDQTYSALIGESTFTFEEAWPFEVQVGDGFEIERGQFQHMISEIQENLATSAAVNAIGVIVTAIAAIFAGITSLAQWLGLIAGKQVGDSTARTELRATGAGGGTYDETTDSLEAARDEFTSAAYLNRSADHARRRTQANVESSSDGDALSDESEYGFLQMAQQSNVVDNPGFITIYKTDETTELAQRPVTSDPSAVPITGIS